MKKSSVLFLLFIALFVFFLSSCEKGIESMLKGTWKEVNYTSDEKCKIKAMTLYLDGVGSFVWTIVDDETRIIRGEYGIDESKQAVYEIYFLHSNISSIMGGYYDFNNNPPVLYNVHLWDTDGTDYQNLKFEKQ